LLAVVDYAAFTTRDVLVRIRFFSILVAPISNFPHTRPFGSWERSFGRASESAAFRALPSSFRFFVAALKLTFLLHHLREVDASTR